VFKRTSLFHDRNRRRVLHGRTCDSLYKRETTLRISDMLGWSEIMSTYTLFTRSSWLDELLYVSWTSQLDVCSIV